MNKADIRRTLQLEFINSNVEIEVGDVLDLPLDISELKMIDHNSKYVVQHFDSGLTANVYKLSINGKYWTLKKKRDDILVKNIDGQTSFLNEIQRRRDFEYLKTLDRQSYQEIVDTTYASLKNEIILSPWIDGHAIKRYTQASIQSLFNTLYHIEIAGLFECDLCSGNLLAHDDGRVRLFDFGYMYPFNPLKEYNSDGKALPIFHSVERFETRSYMQYLMDIEDEIGLEIALNEFRIEKTEALKYYLRKREWLISNNADDDIVDWISSFISIWEDGITDIKMLNNLYDLESFRSYVLDIHDDIGGESCNPDTMRKLDKVIAKINSNYAYLKLNNGLFWGDENISQSQLFNKYYEMKNDVQRFQIRNLNGFEKWRESRIESIKSIFL